MPHVQTCPERLKTGRKSGAAPASTGQPGKRASASLSARTARLLGRRPFALCH
jgi:hypothetical protein